MTGDTCFWMGCACGSGRPRGRKQVQLLVAYGVRADGTRHLLGFTWSTGESQAAWEGRLHDHYRRGVEGRQLQLVVTDGCVGLVAALQTVYPRAAHQRCRVHTRRNLLGAVRRRDHAAMTADAQAIDQATDRAEAVAQAQAFARRWWEASLQLVTRLLRDLPEWLAFCQCPRAIWRKLRTTNVMERCFVEVRRRTRPMVCFVNGQSVERIMFSIFNRFNLEWRQHTLRQFTQVAGHHQQLDAFAIQARLCYGGVHMKSGHYSIPRAFTPSSSRFSAIDALVSALLHTQVSSGRPLNSTGPYCTRPCR